MKTSGIATLLLVSVLLAGCATGLDPTAISPVPSEHYIAGFWWGIWNGLTLPFSFIGSLFSNDIGIYEVRNNGGWYDFGFTVGLLGLGFPTTANR